MTPNRPTLAIGTSGGVTGPAGLFRALLPTYVEVDETRASETDIPLFPEEEHAVAQMVARRRVEFQLGRASARKALHRLTGCTVAIPRSASRAPVWPEGLVGSITHCTGFAAAAVAPARRLAGIGIDAEPAGRDVPDAVIKFICGPHEVARLYHQSRNCRVGTLAFCAKEAVYKCLNPLTGDELEFCDMYLEVGGDGKFRAEILRGPVPVVEGTWAVSRSHVCTTATLPASHAAGLLRWPKEAQPWGARQVDTPASECA